MASLTALETSQSGSAQSGIEHSLIASRQVRHLVGIAVVSGAGMDEDAGGLAELSSFFTGEHRERTLMS